ncbi:MAG: hypothetical protein LBR36_02520 [Bacteroidales bacterium]|jgi:asparagine synthetase B (glutamine-hydrolysing)|nr:hypothetical protein [Bacteroidales bacterium]
MNTQTKSSKCLSSNVLINKPFNVRLLFHYPYCCAQSNEMQVFLEGNLSNQKDLLSDIENTNKSFVAENDAQILLELFTQQGVDCFKKLRGRWNAYIFIPQSQKMYAVRDILGCLALYYSEENQYFTSSILDTEIELNDKKKEEQIWRINNESDLKYKKIKIIPCSSYFVLDLSKEIDYQIVTYYTIPYKNCKAGYNRYEEQLRFDDVRSLIFKALQKSLTNCSHVAAIYTGSMENAMLICAAKKVSPQTEITVFAFSGRLSKNSPPEQNIRSAGVKWVEVDCENDDNKIEKELFKSIVNDGITTFISEYGCAKLFAGDSECFVPFLRSLRNQWMWSNWCKERIKARRSGISSAKLKQIKSDFAKILKNNSIEVLNDYLYLRFADCLHLRNTYTAFITRFVSTHLNILTPFCDDLELVEYVFSVPSTLKIHNGYDSYLLRNAMVGVVNEEVMWMKRPINTWELLSLFDL